MKKILISDSVDDKCISTLESAGFSVQYSAEVNPAGLKKIIKNFNGLIVRSSTQVTADLINEMEKMEVIGRAGSGVDNIDINAATRKGILVMNTPGGNTISAAEHTIALLLSLSRNIPQASKTLSEKKWDRKTFKGTELFGKKLGLIGLGKIGKEVALRALAFGIDVIAFDPLLSEEVASEIGVRIVNLESIWKEADIISLHTPLNEKTKHIISAGTIAKCRRGVIIINCARGGLVDEKALIDGLDKGKISAAALDVFEQEPPDFKSRIFNHPKIVCTPHLGASTREAQQKVAVQIAEQIADYFKGNSVKGAVNASAGFEAIAPLAKPFLLLSEVLGKLHAQLLQGNLKKIKINFSGEMLHKPARQLTTSFLKGFLSVELSDTVNFVNAPVLAQEMGIIIDETITAEHSDYSNLLSVTVETDNRETLLAGTVFGSSSIRIVMINDYYVEFNPSGNLLLFYNIDKPGMLSVVSKQLADANINIASLALGRVEEGKNALTVINLDSAIQDKTFNSISNMEGIKDIYSVYI